MTASDLLTTLTALGATVQAVEDRLRIEAPQGALTPELRSALVEQKPALLCLLARPSPRAEPPPDVLRAERKRADRAREERREWGDDLCHRVSAGIAYQSPPGLGSWPQAWRIVAAVDARLLALLAIFEETGEEGDRRAAVHAAEDLAIAWEKAAKAWEATKR